MGSFERKAKRMKLRAAYDRFGEQWREEKNKRDIESMKDDLGARLSDSIPDYVPYVPSVSTQQLGRKPTFAQYVEQTKRMTLFRAARKAPAGPLVVPSKVDDLEWNDE